MQETRLKIAKADIVSYFDNSKQNIFNKSDIKNIINNNKQFWRLANSTSIDEFLKFLVDETKMKKIDLGFSYRKIIKYIWDGVSLYSFVQAVSGILKNPIISSPNPDETG